MPHIEYYAKLKIHNGKMDKVKHAMDGINAAAKALGAQMLRSDWYLNEAKHEAATVTVYNDEAALHVHCQQASEYFAALAANSEGSLQFFGAAPAQIHAALAAFIPAKFQFAYGIKSNPTPIHSTKRGIEIYSLFSIFPGKLNEFKAVGAELLPIIRSKDPGTTRYDWFYDDANLKCVALDCYADTPSMFAHMKNAHDVHELLYNCSTMLTEFLGELPDDAKAAVARYDPNVLPLCAALS